MRSWIASAAQTHASRGVHRTAQCCFGSFCMLCALQNALAQSSISPRPLLNDPSGGRGGQGVIWGLAHPGQPTHVRNPGGKCDWAKGLER